MFEGVQLAPIAAFAACLLLLTVALSGLLVGFLLGRTTRPLSLPPRLPPESTASEAQPQTPTQVPAKPLIISPPSTVVIPHPVTPADLLHKRLASIDLASIDIQRTPEWDKALNHMGGASRCLFITGEAGTGKSTLLRYFVANTTKPVVVLAPTGVAALNVGGQTIHSFFRFPRGPINAIEKTPFKGELYRAIDILIIDEVSMVRADLLDAVDQSLRVNRGDVGKPFGGLRIVFVGDLFQLQPVVREVEEGQFFSQYYASPFFFDAKVFHDVDLRVIKLKTVYRQTDPAFMDILNRIRVNRVRESDLELLNTRVLPNFQPDPSLGYIELTTTNRSAEQKNHVELAKLPPPDTEYQATVTGDFLESQYPTDYILRLRIGAQVMLLNNDPGRRWVNGTVALIDDLAEDTVTVRIPSPPDQPDRICQVSRHTWDVCKYRINHTAKRLESEPVGSFTQFPIKLAWAITIHKGQGKTLDRAIIDLSRGTFAHGQAYVALSRCATLEGLVLRAPLRRRDIIVDPRVFRFMDAMARHVRRVS